MVTDVSPGTNDAALTMRFPNGVPAIADEYMSEWMLYVYKQFECPMMLNGVEVSWRLLILTATSTRSAQSPATQLDVTHTVGTTSTWRIHYYRHFRRLRLIL